MADAELILTGGKIVTLDGKSRIVGALAVRGDRIAALGDDSEVARLAGPGTRCDSGSWAGRRPSLGGYVTGPGATRGVPAAGRR